MNMRLYRKTLSYKQQRFLDSLWLSMCDGFGVTKDRLSKNSRFSLAVISRWVKDFERRGIMRHWYKGGKQYVGLTPEYIKLRMKTSTRLDDL